MVLQIDLSDRLVLVTGGARGVGTGIAERFLEAGADVVISGGHPPDRLPSAGDREATFLAADVRETAEVESLFHRVRSEHGRLDVLVNNAGGAPSTEAATASARFAAAIAMVNLQSALTCSRQANEMMQEQPEGGCIINIGSTSGLREAAGSAAYGAATSGLVNLTTSLAADWAPKVRVNCVSAGLILTEQAHIHYGDEIGQARVAATVPLGRLGTPQDVGAACVFLASPLADYISGANIVVHGGGERPAFLDASKE
jgi:NAD(P)-dependent dehydrogenase (short-subunit alcohol dehydrogenase family)